MADVWVRCGNCPRHATASQMREPVRRLVPPVVQPVDVRDGNARELFLGEPSRQPTFTPYIVPMGVSLPTPNARTPQCLQKKCWFFRVLKRYSVRSCSPESSRKPSGRATAGQKRARLQIEQLQRYVRGERSRSASNRTAPQWQLPVYVFSMLRAPQAGNVQPDGKSSGALDSPSCCSDRARASVLRAHDRDRGGGARIQSAARLQVTVPTPPLDAVGVMYLSSSLLLGASRRFCSVPFQFGNVALATLNVSVLSAGLTR